MIGRKILWIAFSAAFVLMLVITLLFSNVQLIAFNRDYYETQYEKFKVYDEIGIKKADMTIATDNLLDYIDDKRDNLDFQMEIKGSKQEFFSQRDKLHMIDVKNLFVQGKIIRNIALGYCIIFIAGVYFIRRNRVKTFSKLMIYAFIAGIIPIILLVILMNIDFYKYFTIFHEIFFNNDLWQLDPKQDRLINMYPEAFFSGIAFRIAFYYIGELVLLLILGIAGLRYTKKKTLF